MSDVASLPPKVNLLVTVFTYARQIGADVFSYCCNVAPQLRGLDWIENVVVSYTHGYPTDRCRNAACKQAKQDGFHFLLALDDDMKPDCLLGQDTGAKPFLPTALEFMRSHDGPCLVGAPYCSTPPFQDVLVMKQRVVAPDNLDGMGVKIDKYTRDEAAVMTGIQRVAALPTGCLLIDLRALDILPPPWFAYEYADSPFNTTLASTEDVVFTRNCDWLGVPNYCAWDSWAGHVKTFTTGKPRLSPVDEVPKSIHAAYLKGWRPKSVTP